MLLLSLLRGKNKVKGLGKAARWVSVLWIPHPQFFLSHLATAVLSMSPEVNGPVRIQIPETPSERLKRDLWILRPSLSRA